MDTLPSSSAALNNSGKLAGKIALITGGNSGIGLATAKRFVAEGAYVFITGRRQANLEEAVKDIGPEHATGLQGDSSKLADLDRIFAAIKEQKGRLDVVFANAGFGSFVPLDQITEEHFDTIYGTNVKGVVFTVQRALPLMGEGGTPEEIARAVVFLACEDSAYVNAVELFVDGGATQV